jgi:hypothetical protein
MEVLPDDFAHLSVRVRHPDLSGFSGAAGIRPGIYAGSFGVAPPISPFARLFAAEGGKQASERRTL